MSTEYREPFYLEWQGNLLVARCTQPFTGTMSCTMQAEQQAAIFALPAMAMQKGLRLLLSTTGHSDVLVLPRGGTN